jgi:dTMP kinase
MFITLEGIEGSGKTTQLPHIRDLLEGLGRPCVVTREPGGTPTGLKIRSILLDPENTGLVPRAELLLYFADRVQHVEQVVLPALSAGKTVLCDRYVDATIVYQGMARGLGADLVESLHRLLLGDLKPDLTLLFDLPAQKGLARAWRALNLGGRPTAESRFESEDRDFHERVRNGYLELAHREPDRYRVIDAAAGEEQVRAAVFSVLSEELKRR